MLGIDPDRPAALVATIHAPWRASVADCLQRWTGLDARARANSYLVVEADEPGLRRTLNAHMIALLAEETARLHAA